MKKLFAIILAAALCLSLGTAAFAAEDVLLIAPAPAAGVNVNVTISDAGKLVLVQKPVYVTDADADGALTINDALILAHTEYYEGGAEVYITYSSDYGLAINKLWGVENGGSYMYYLNDLMPLSLTEAVKEGDCVTAYGFADLEGWSDVYTYFDVHHAAVDAGETVELTLKGYDWNLDPNGNASPMAGVTIYVDGAATDVVTNDEGKAVVTLSKVGNYVISAKSETATLTPPVCTVKVGFADVNAEDSYAPAVDYLVENGLLNGIADEKFEPAGEASRALIVTVLHKLEGSPDVPNDRELPVFSDVEGTDAMTIDAFRWASYEGIIEGYGNGKAGPADKVTREQMATILWRYAKGKGVDVSVGENTNILSYNDAFEISEWAVPAIQWACGAGLMEGDANGNILPGAEVTRGEMAQLVYELSQLIP